MHIKRHKISRIIKDIKEGGRLPIVTKNNGMSLSTWYAWEEYSSRLFKLRKRAEEICDMKRNTIVEDSFFNRFIGGKATTADYVFYLTNRMSDRWQDRRAIVNNSNAIQVQSVLQDHEFTGEDKKRQEELAEYLRKYADG